MSNGSNTALVVRGGTVVTAAGAHKADVAITEIAESIKPGKSAVTIDATDCWVGPGLVDLHTHLREPGNEAAETIETGSRAAALAGTPPCWPCRTPPRRLTPSAW
jgi:dihydroorotase